MHLKQKTGKKDEVKNHFSLDGVSRAGQCGLVELCSLFLLLVELFPAEAQVLECVCMPHLLISHCWVLMESMWNGFQDVPFPVTLLLLNPYSFTILLGEKVDKCLYLCKRDRVMWWSLLMFSVNIGSPGSKQQTVLADDTLLFHQMSMSMFLARLWGLCEASVYGWSVSACQQVMMSSVCEIRSVGIELEIKAQSGKSVI